ncbi:hypothetical protein [Komagataeibacter rhaeticus]|uniref:Uncharacterized protein n=1 Tax=Komagataeibacter rhaeticus TaxID=215221 RepID=A0A858JG39_9PROT|nr:hypothetical protein [Komagataeibacter rhaeticus]QIP35456.1 hypothetical protein GWK63_08270 [Komagataeibacter rhaeticus]QOC45211.1 hypothetical protein ICJ78_08320 [Komagataeibacter rhaeticus]WPP22389.1 hypothetical protein SCD25_02520 [Komagataeibacter rhaeticus]
MPDVLDPDPAVAGWMVGTVAVAAPMAVLHPGGKAGRRAGCARYGTACASPV